mgnify:CR=1 FL=1
MVVQRNYVTTVGIHVGKASRRVVFFWFEVLDTAEKNGSYEIYCKVDDIREATSWDCPVNRTSVSALSQLHEVYTDDAAHG